MSLAAYCLVIIVLLSSTQPISSAVPLEIPYFRFHDPYRCSERNGTYCFVTTMLRLPNSTSESWEQPRKLSVKNNRNLLEWGLCTEDCLDRIRRLNNQNQEMILQQPRHSAAKYFLMYPDHYFPEREYFEDRLGKLMQLCVNRFLLSHYHDMGYPHLENCIINSNTPWIISDWYTYLFYSLFFSSIFCFTFWNVLDLCIPRRSRRLRIIRACSIRTNWVNLTKCSQEDKYLENRRREGLRLLLVIAVIAFNCFMLMISFPVKNPEQIEKLLDNMFLLNILSCAFWIIPAFLTVDGFMLITKFLISRDREGVQGRYYVRYEILDRLVESFPLYSQVLFYSSVMDSVWGSNKTIGRYLMLTREARICRRNMWSNLLLINNYPTSKEICYAPGWYFATTTQLFMLGMGLLAFMWKYPKSTPFVKRTIPAIAVILPGIVAYLFSCAPLPALRLNDIRTGFNYQLWYRLLYLPTHMNFGCYVIGMLAGYYRYTKQAEKPPSPESCTSIWIKRLSFPLVIFTGCIPAAFYSYELNVPGLFTTIYAILFHHSSSIFLAVCLYWNFRNLPRCLTCCIETRLFIIPARLCYGMYLVHPLVARLRLSVNVPYNTFDLSEYPVLLFEVYGASFTLSIVLYLFIEQPCRYYFGSILKKKLHPSRWDIPRHD